MGGNGIEKDIPAHLYCVGPAKTVSEGQAQCTVRLKCHSIQ